MKQKNFYFYTNLLAWGLMLLLAGNYVFGWTTPTATPPGSNLPAPINVSSTAQSKVGYLAIATSTAPSYPLDVAGTIQATGLKIPTGAGADKVLTSDASGVASWQTAAGGGTPAGSTGYVQFNDGGVFAATSTFFWDNTNARLGIATTTPAQTLHVAGTGKFSGALDMTTQKITNLATPTAASDAATKGYVDAGTFSCRQVTNTCSGTDTCMATCATTERALGGLCAQGGQTNSYLTQIGNCSTYQWCCYWNSSQTYNRYAYANCCK